MIFLKIIFKENCIYLKNVIWIYIYSGVDGTQLVVLGGWGGGRAGLKPMQTDAAALGPAPLGLRTMVFGSIVHFCQIHLALENSVETPY